MYDFIGNKTGMFGMTRMGKSNTMKTVAARVFAVSERRRAAGQAADRAAHLRPAGRVRQPQHAGRHGAGGDRRRSCCDLQVRRSDRTVSPTSAPSGINFFDPAQIDAAKAMIASALAAASADYVQGFIMADFDGAPLESDTEGEARERMAERTAAGCCCMARWRRQDFAIPHQHMTPDGKRYPWRAWVTMRKELADELENQLGTGHLNRPERSAGR